METSRVTVMPPVSRAYPWFVVAQNPEDEGDDSQVHILDNIHDRMSHYRFQIPELLGKRIRGCFHDSWAVLSSNHCFTWSLWNPYTSKIINLPPMKPLYDIGECCLSAPPEDPSSMLLLMRTSKPIIAYCKIKDSIWTELTYANEIKSIITDQCDGSLHCITCCNGKLYAYVRQTGDRLHAILIVEVNIVVNGRGVVITLLPIMEFWCPHLSSNPPLLKGSCTELFFIVICLEHNGKTVAAVRPFKVDVKNMTLRELEDLEDTMLSVELATDSSVFYSPAIASSGLGGYIHILADKGKTIYSYHIKDKIIFVSSIPCVTGSNNVAMLEFTGLGGDRVHVHCKQEKEGHKEDQIVVRSVKSDHEVESHLLNLPPHVLEMLITEHCAGVDYLKFRSTCKRCHLGAPLMSWNNGKVSKIMQKYSLPTPWLIVFNKHKGISTLTDPMFGDKYFIKTPQELICKFQIKCSRFGWLLILKPDERSLMFFNPFTSDIIQLPQLPHANIISFSAPPTSPNCMVVGITVDMPGHVCIHIVGGEPSWRRLVFDNKCRNRLYSVTLYGRDLYALRDNGRLDVLKVMDREDCILVRNVAQSPASCGTSVPQYFHLRCDQHTLRVIVGKFGESVEVFKLTVSREWVKIDSLGKHMIFICGTSSFCLDAKTSHMENKIYFPSSPIMYYYSLETCRFHTSINGDVKDSFGDLRGTKHHLGPHGWIEPRWS